MERFWRTLREGCLDFLGSLTSLHDVNVRLLAFLDAHYHLAPHAGLYGRAPKAVLDAAPPRVDALDEASLRASLTTASCSAPPRRRWSRPTSSRRLPSSGWATTSALSDGHHSGGSRLHQATRFATLTDGFHPVDGLETQHLLLDVGGQQQKV